MRVGYEDVDFANYLILLAQAKVSELYIYYANFHARVYAIRASLAGAT